MATHSYEPDDELTADLLKTTDDLIEGSKRLLAELDAELGKRRRPTSLADEGEQRRSA